MKVFNAAYRSVVVGGAVYTADADGAIDIPDGLVHPGLWAMGFVQIKPRPTPDASLADALKVAATGQETLDTADAPVAAPENPQADTQAGQAVQAAEAAGDGGGPKATDKPVKTSKGMGMK